MPGEKDTIFSSKVKYTGVFKFSDFYKFCYDWLVEEFGLAVVEEQYIEKIKGTTKDVEFKWVGTKEVTDYFKFEVKLHFKILKIEEIEVVQDKVKAKMNKGGIEVKISSIINRDYKGKFDTSALRKFLRGVYEKWVIPSRIEEYEDKLVGNSDEFLSQVKAYLDLEGKR